MNKIIIEVESFLINNLKCELTYKFDGDNFDRDSIFKKLLLLSELKKFNELENINIILKNKENLLEFLEHYINEVEYFTLEYYEILTYINNYLESELN